MLNGLRVIKVENSKGCQGALCDESEKYQRCSRGFVETLCDKSGKEQRMLKGLCVIKVENSKGCSRDFVCCKWPHHSVDGAE